MYGALKSVLKYLYEDISIVIKAVSFDLWFTLIWEKHPEDEELYNNMRTESILRVLKSRGYEVPTARVRELYLELKGARMIMSSKDVASVILAGLGLKHSNDLIDEVSEAYELSTEAFKPRENPEALTVLSVLKDTGMRLAIVSNTSFSARGVRALLKNVGIADYIDVIVSSSDVGSVKPQRSIFQVLARSIGAKPEELVHVGDACVEDVLGALGYGMRAVYYIGLLHLRKAEPNRVCLELVPTIRRLGDLIDVLRRMR